MSDETEKKDDYSEIRLHVPEKMVGYIIGPKGKNINNIQKDTDTFIRTEWDYAKKRTNFVIKGGSKNVYHAKLKIKQNVNIGKIKEKGLASHRSHFIDAEEGQFELKSIISTDPRLKDNSYVKMVSKAEENDNCNGTGKLSPLLKELQKAFSRNKEKQRKSNVWCHFGNIYVIGSSEDQNTEYSMDELERRIKNGPRQRFLSGINMNKGMGFHALVKSGFLKDQLAIAPYLRYERTYCTPSCGELRLKIFFQIEDESNQLYRNAKCPHKVNDSLKASDSPPYFYICESTPKTSLIDIFEPSAPVDIRLITEAIPTLASFSEEDEIYKEVQILYDFVKDNLHVNEKGKVDLPDSSLDGFDCRYIRVSKRHSYCRFTSEGKEFTVRRSSELIERPNNFSIKEFENKSEVDIHLLFDDSTSRSPDEIIEQFPLLLSCARTLARRVTMEENTVPPEILARGSKAQSAYQTALKSGKVKNCRVSIVVVGQSRSGKTSLLRSLNGEKFNPREDSTIGAKLQRSLSKFEGVHWENETDEHTMYNQCAARAMVEHLLKEPADLDDGDSGEDDSSTSFKDEEHDIRSSLVENDGLDMDGCVTLQENVQQFQEDSKNAKGDTAKGKTVQEAVDNTLNGTGILKVPEAVSTYTANILENPDAAEQMKNNLFFHTMDFAGQPVYSVTHPVFLPPKGIYLLVHSLQNDLHVQAEPMVKYGAAERIIDDHCPMTNMDHLKFWLSLIAANSTVEGGSPVFAVSTHADKPLEPDVKQTARTILDTLTRDDFAPGDHVVHGIYTVDNTISGSGHPEDPAIQGLKAEIYKKARSLPQLNEDIPIRWLLFEKKLNQLVNEDQTKYISHKNAEAIAVQCEIDIDSDELSTLLDYLHDLKVIIYFPETNMVIIDTQWLLDMFAKVITVQPIEYHEGYKSEWRKLEKEGIVDVMFLYHLWSSHLDDHKSVQSLLAIMEKFSLICKQRDGSFLVPAMLLNAPMSNELMNKDGMLVVRFKSSHLPFGLFPRLLVAVDEMCNLKWPDSPPPHLSRNFARFYILIERSTMISLVFTSEVQTITVALVKIENQDDRSDPIVELCGFILNFLKETLQKMMESFPWMKSLEFEFGIRCPICDCTAPCTKHNQRNCFRDSCIHFVSEEELLKTLKPLCLKNPTKAKNILIPASSFSQWFQRTINHSDVAEEVQKKVHALSLHSSGTEGDVCKEIMKDANRNPQSISLDEATDKAKQLAEQLNLDKNCIEDPPKDVTQRCRKSCRQLIDQGGEICVQAIRNEFPNGMTGPLKLKHDELVKDMDFHTKVELSEAFTGHEMEWKAFAKEEVGLSFDKIKYLDKRKENPVLEILNNTDCGRWSVERLYDAMVKSGAAAIADRYL